MATDEFTWHGERFLWRSGTTPPEFSNDTRGTFHGVVKPVGKAWDAKLFIGGGAMRGVGATPEAALDIALGNWQASVARVAGSP